MSITCTRCGQSVKDENAVRINGKFYGQDCAANLMGMKSLPQWFKGGDYDKANAKHQENVEKLNAEYERRKALTAEYYQEWYKLTRFFNYANESDNEWLYNFAISILSQLGYDNIISYPNADTFDKYMDCGYGHDLLNNEPRRISTLSPKQQAILNKYI